MAFDGSYRFDAAKVYIFQVKYMASPHRSARLRRASDGQAAVEYMLVMLFLTLGFSLLYPALKAALTTEFQSAGYRILKAYY